MGSGGTTFKGIATGDYTFTGQDAGNTLSYAADTDGVTINLASDTVSKDLATVQTAQLVARTASATSRPSTAAPAVTLCSTAPAPA